MDTSSGLGVIIYLVIALLGLFISIVWIVFPFIVMGRMTRLEEKIAEGNQAAHSLLQETSKTNDHLARLIDITKKASAPVSRKTSPIPLPIVETVNPQTMAISKDGENIGDFTVTTVKQMLKTNRLTLQDMFFDTTTNEWTTLDLNPALY